MSRLIDADGLKKCVLKWLPQDPCGIEEKEMPFGTDICVSMLMEIDEQPTITLEPHWIPVTERLPDVGCEVLVEMDDKVSISIGYVDPCGWWFVDFSTEERDDVIAWMPLPEPYKGVTE